MVQVGNNTNIPYMRYVKFMLNKQAKESLIN